MHPFELNKLYSRIKLGLTRRPAPIVRFVAGIYSWKLSPIICPTFIQVFDEQMRLCTCRRLESVVGSTLHLLA